MKTFDVAGKIRVSVGKKDSKALRAEGNVPCVIYGGEKPIHFYATASQFRKLVYTPNVFLVNLDLEGKNIQAIMQDIQFQAVTDEIVHIDFLEAPEDKPVKVNVPVKVHGFAKGIRQGGKLQVETRRLTVLALPKDLPDVIDIDVTELELGQSFRVEDIKDDKLQILNGKSVPVARVMITRAARAAMNEGGGEV